MIRPEVALPMAYGIPGWQWPSELLWVTQAFAKSKAHAEVGVYCGKSMFTAAAGMTSDAKIYAVDSFVNTPVAKGWTRRVFEATKTLTENRTSARVELIAKDSIDAFRQLADRGVVLDSVYIDGCHEYAECKADIEAWSTLVRPGGTIAGHDYWPRDPGVMDAVNETGPFKVVPGTRIWHRQA